MDGGRGEAFARELRLQLEGKNDALAGRDAQPAVGGLLYPKGECKLVQRPPRRPVLHADAQRVRWFTSVLGGPEEAEGDAKVEGRGEVLVHIHHRRNALLGGVLPR